MLCGKQIQKRILDECRNAKYFSLIADETTDMSVKEQVRIVLLYVNHVENDMKSLFLLIQQVEQLAKRYIHISVKS